MEEDILNITPLFFTYGTLKYGHGNWSRLLRDEEYVGSTLTAEKYVLGDVGCPYMFKDVEGFVPEELLKPVVGDLFKVSDDITVVALDRLEGHPTHYTRELMETSQGDLCWGYFNKRLSDLHHCYKCDVTETNEWVWNPYKSHKGSNNAAD